MPLLGMLAAGAGMGAARASNLNTQAANELEIGDRREMLRMQFLEHQYQQGRADNLADAKNNALLNEAKYERDRGDKLSDAELKHKQSKELIGIQESGRNARTASTNASRKEAALLRSGASAGKGADGQTFKPNSPEYRFATDLVNAGEFDHLPEPERLSAAIRLVISRGLVGQAAGSVHGLTDGIVATSRRFGNELFGNNLVPQQGTSNRLKYEDLLK